MIDIFNTTSYFCWATLMFKEYEDEIVAQMVSNGYQVRTALEKSNKFTMGKKNDVGRLFIILVSHISKAVTAKMVLKDFEAALEYAKAKYYSVLVTSHMDAAFGSSNIVLPEPEQPSKPAME